MKDGLISNHSQTRANNYVGGVDLSYGKDFTININANIKVDKDKLIEEMIKELYDPKEPRRSGIIV